QPGTMAAACSLFAREDSLDDGSRDVGHRTALQSARERRHARKRGSMWRLDQRAYPGGRADRREELFTSRRVSGFLFSELRNLRRTTRSVQRQTSGLLSIEKNGGRSLSTFLSDDGRERVRERLSTDGRIPGSDFEPSHVRRYFLVSERS